MKILILIIISIITEINPKAKNLLNLIKQKLSQIDIFIDARADLEYEVKSKMYKILVSSEKVLKKKYQVSIISTEKDNELYEYRQTLDVGSRMFYIWKNYYKNLNNYIAIVYSEKVLFSLFNLILLDNLFSDYDILLLPKRRLDITYAENLEKYIDKDYLHAISNLINKNFPDYYNSYIKTMNQKEEYNDVVFLMKKQDFNIYCRFIYKIMFDFFITNNFWNDNDIRKHCSSKYDNKKMINFCESTPYLIFVVLSNIFFNHHFKKPYVFNYSNK